LNKNRCREYQLRLAEDPSSRPLVLAAERGSAFRLLSSSCRAISRTEPDLGRTRAQVVSERSAHLAALERAVVLAVKELADRVALLRLEEGPSDVVGKGGPLVVRRRRRVEDEGVVRVVVGRVVEARLGRGGLEEGREDRFAREDCDEGDGAQSARCTRLRERRRRRTHSSWKSTVRRVVRLG